MCDMSFFSKKNVLGVSFFFWWENSKLSIPLLQGSVVRLRLPRGRRPRPREDLQERRGGEVPRPGQEPEAPGSVAIRFCTVLDTAFSQLFGPKLKDAI